jgi:protein TonB
VPLVRAESAREDASLVEPFEVRRSVVEEAPLLQELDARVPEDAAEPPSPEPMRQVQESPRVLRASDLVALAPPPLESTEVGPRPAPAETAPSSTPAIPLAGECPPPEYPRESIRRGEEGTVWLRVRVGPDGAVLDLAVATPSGSERLDGAARAAVARWRFVPATVGGIRVEQEALLPVRFRLEAMRE